jgi:hypothetical protein
VRCGDEERRESDKSGRNKRSSSGELMWATGEYTMSLW